MSAYNPPCQAELTFMHVLPVKMAGMTEAMLKLATSMDRLAASIEKANVLAEREQVTEHHDGMPMYVVPPSFTAKEEIPGEKDARAAAEGRHG